MLKTEKKMYYLNYYKHCGIVLYFILPKLAISCLIGQSAQTVNPRLPEAFFCNTSTEGGGYHPLPRFSL